MARCLAPKGRMIVVSGTTTGLCVSEAELGIIRAVLREYACGCEVRVFGSRYRGGAKKYSDLDIAIIGKEKLSLCQMGNIREAFAESNLPFRVDVLDWHSITKEFQAVINRGYGVVLF